jgi:hypothetical protein
LWNALSCYPGDPRWTPGLSIATVSFFKSPHFGATVLGDPVFILKRDKIKAIKEKFPDNKVFLCVTHGIFSNSFLELSMYFENVYSTNSYSDIECSEHSQYTVDTKFLWQLEVL